MASGMDAAVLQQINRTIELLEANLDRVDKELGERTGMGIHSPAQSMEYEAVFSHPVRRSHPMDNTEQLQGNANFRESTDTYFGTCSCTPSVNLDSEFDSTMLGSRKPVVQPDIFDGRHPQFDDWLTHFNLCGQINCWTGVQKAKFLAVKLRGSALQVYTDLPDSKEANYADIVKALQERFSPQGQTELYRAQLKARVHRKGKSLPELPSDIRRLVLKAYPDVSPEFRDEIGRDCFLDALDSPDIRIQLRRLN